MEASPPPPLGGSDEKKEKVFTIHNLRRTWYINKYYNIRTIITNRYQFNGKRRKKKKSIVK